MTEQSIPAWEVVKLKDLSERITKGSTPTSYGYPYTTEGIRFIKAENIDSDGIASSTTNHIDSETHQFLKRSILKNNDILFSIAGTIGRVGLLRSADLPANTNQALAIIRLKQGVVDHKYLFHFLRSPAIQKTALKQIVGVGRANLSLENIGEFEIPIAPLDQQKRIVAEIEKQFSRLDEAVANLKRVKANLKRYKAAVLKAAVEGRLVETEAERARSEGRSYETGAQLLQRILETRRSQWQGKGKYKEPAAADTTDLPELPEGWVWATIEQLTWLVTSGSRGWGDYYSDEGVLFIRAQDIKTDSLNVGGVARVTIPKGAEGTRSSVSSQDILITITGANVTKSALVPALDEVAFVSQHVALLKLNLPEMAPFVFAWIVSPSNGRKLLESWAYGAGKPGLSLEQIRSLPVALPPMPEQHRIVAEVDRSLSLIRETESQVNANLQRAERLRSSVISKSFSNGI